MEKADVVPSDLAPNVSGLWEMDQLKQIDLTKSIGVYKNSTERKRLCFIQSFSRGKHCRIHKLFKRIFSKCNYYKT